MGPINWDVVRVGSIPSTMDEIDWRARSGAPEGTVVVADEQTAGRGRAGRMWSAPPGSSLLCSILLRPASPAERISAFPLLTGVAVAEAIESVAPVRCGLKWPNDVLIEGRKVAGVLVQSRVMGPSIDFLNIGIGINVGTGLTDLPEEATSILTASGAVVDRDELLSSLLERIEHWYARALDSAPSPDLSPWTDRAVFLGEEVVAVQEGVEVRGVLQGVSSRGGMLLRTSDGHLIEVVQGDLVRGPRPAAGVG